MPFPVVTAVLPTFNRASLLHRAIGSVLSQSYRDFELIVVDDGSTDDTGGLVRSRYGDRVRYLRQQNRGLSAARNAGIQAARGTYIALNDDDDTWTPERLACQVPILDRDPAVGLVYSAALLVDDNGATLGPFRARGQCRSGEVFLHLLDGSFIANPTVLVRRECFDWCGLFDESLETNEDWDMWMRIAMHYRFAYVNKIGAHIRVHRGQKTAVERLDGRMYSSAQRVLQKTFDSLPLRWRHLEECRGRRLAREQVRLSGALAETGDMPGARARALETIGGEPGVLRDAKACEIISVLAARLAMQPGEPQAFLDAVAEVAGHIAQDGGVMRTLTAATSAQMAFQRAKHGDRLEAGRAALSSVLASPRWALNRGIASLCLQHALRSVWAPSRGHRTEEAQ